MNPLDPKLPLEPEETSSNPPVPVDPVPDAPQEDSTAEETAEDKELVTKTGEAYPL